jgi:2-polyprenyl-3-methyl-5-hydroxy-6-metoxy-1,4-benzoquinol methylase
MAYVAGCMAGAWDEITHIYFIREKFIRLVDAHVLRKLPAHFENVLDIGCGTGSLTKILASRSRFVVAVDIASKMLEMAGKTNKSHNIKYINSDFNSLNLKKEFFDLIISIDTLHYLDIESAFIKTKEALKRGGVLLIADLIELKSPNPAINAKRKIARFAHLFFYILKKEKLKTALVYWSLLKYRRKWKNHDIAMKKMNIKRLFLNEFSETARRYLPGCDIELLKPFDWAVIRWRKK